MAVIICGLMCLWVGRGWTRFRKLMWMKLVRSEPFFGNGSISACSTGSSFLTHCNIILIDHLTQNHRKKSRTRPHNTAKSFFPLHFILKTLV